MLDSITDSQEEMEGKTEEMVGLRSEKSKWSCHSEASGEWQTRVGKNGRSLHSSMVRL